MSTPIPTEKEYAEREAREHYRAVLEVERAPLADRQEARRDYLHAMVETPDVVAQRIWWLLTGVYGYGAQQAALGVLRDGTRNKPAAIGAMIAALEWRCPSRFAAQAFAELNKRQQAKVTKLVQGEIDDYRKQYPGDVTP